MQSLNLIKRIKFYPSPNDFKKEHINFSPYRAVLIPKSKGKFRPLQIPEVSDRVVIKAIAIELEEHFKELLEKSRGLSFAYQKGLGVKEAVEKINEYCQNGYSYVLEAI